MTLRPFLRDLTSAILRETPAFCGDRHGRRAGESGQRKEEEPARTMKPVNRDVRRRPVTAR
jgi:hypothetical protein